ncbi:Ca2+-binding RTX toxin-like protein [Inhella inkyongensis]|uniref:Ca2+-binding RTX toxin-like protein n=1 Tax=Inhella inkyongensis TaxID=392593 RepID=A0A840SCF5_9BURK|nr:calcium-binding protein [Inhella inkyongensis]MBB5206444.1 Ca2+-binding RTX toxin-like protein [Inhella inkyongensis]
MAEWAADAALSEVGALIGSAVAAIALAAAGAAGAVVSAPVAGAAVLGAALVGSFFGSDAAERLGEYFEDRDHSGRMDALEKLQGLLFGQSWTVTDTPPPDLLAKALQLNADFLVKSLQLTYSREDIVALAKTSIAWRYALRELTGFAVEGLNYDEYNLDGSLDLFDPATGEGGMTEEYLKDRAAMMMWKVRFDRGMADDNDGPNLSDRSKSYYEDWDIASIEGNWDFVDRKHLVAGDPLTLQIDGSGISVHDHQVVFGTAKDEEFHGEGDNDRLYGGGGADKITGRKGSDYIEGNGGNDKLYGDEGHDTLRGGSGSDELEGGVGSDLLQGEAGNDILHGGEGHDALSGGSGADELHGDAGNDVLIGGTGADILKGGADNDILFDEGGAEVNYLWGEAGNDALEIQAGTGKNFLDGGSGNDVLIGSRAGGNALTGGTGNDWLQGGDGLDILVGDGGVADSGGGADGADLIEAGGGADQITGGGGSDLLRGGAGQDHYRFEGAGFGTDVIDDADGQGELVFAGQILKTASFSEDKQCWIASGPNSGGVEIRKLESEGSITLAISLDGDVQSTVYLRNWTPGQLGLTLTGEPKLRDRPTATPVKPQSRAENNFVDFVRGDAVDADQGNDLLVGSDASSLLLGGTGNDLLDGRGGDDWLEGGEGTDLILTGAGKDVVLGGGGKDLIRAGYRFDMSMDKVYTPGGGWYAASSHKIFFSQGAGVAEWLATDENTRTQFSYYVLKSDTPGETERERIDIAHPNLAAFDFEFKAELGAGSQPPSHLWWWSYANEAVPRLVPNLSVTLTLGANEQVARDAVFKKSEAPDPLDLGAAMPFKLELENGQYILAPGSQAQGVAFFGGGGDDALFGANDNDRLHGEVGDDLLIGEGGDDELVGGAGLDSISGGDGRDRLDGGAEADFLVGGLGADVLLGGAGHDLLLGDAPYQQGNTVAPFYPVGLDVGAMGGDLLDGGSGNDTLFGNHGDDGLFGGADDDLLWGGEGQDRLFGDAGADELVGGLGDDPAGPRTGALRWPRQAVDREGGGRWNGSVVIQQEERTLRERANDLPPTSFALASVGRKGAANDERFGRAA